MYVFAQLGDLNLASCNLQEFPDLRNHSYLAYLDLSNNQITGEIPNWIWDLGNLGELNLSFNLLMDFQKPYQFPPQLDGLYLQSNQLKGQLPSFPLMGRLIDFSNNKFHGSLPFGNSTEYLEFLSIANNNVSGRIPPSLCNATDLAVLDFYGNKLSNTIPPCLMKDLVNLKVLNLATNNINGGIPDSLSKECKLQSLDLSKNRFKGSIPPSLANCNALEVMNVGSNTIKDGFPCMIPASLRVLVLRSNNFHGKVRCNKSWPNLQIIDIASNNFSGNLHQMNFLSWTGMMQDTHLHSDFLSGPEEYNYEEKVTLTMKGVELEVTRILKIFSSGDFSCNNFQREIPDAVGELKSLYALNLSHNALTGAIPKSFGNLSELESLDLSNNLLTGEIPMEFVRLTFLSVLNLSYNKLVGAIPQGYQLQTFTESSFQGNTGLCGFPLDKMCNNTNETGSSVGGEPPSKKEEIEWAYVLAAIGLGVGFGSVVWLLFGCESINIRFSKKADEIFEYMFNL